MLKKIATAMAVLGASMSVANATQTISGNMDLRVDLPEVLVLYHWGEVGIEFNPVVRSYAAGMGAGATGFDRTSLEIRDSDRETYADVTDAELVTTNTPNGEDKNDISVVLKDSWAVRSISNNGVKLTIANTTPDHVHDGDLTSKVKTKDVMVKSTDSVAGPTAANPANEINLNSQWAPIKGDIQFKLNFEEAKKSGPHKSNGNTFTLTLATL